MSRVFRGSSILMAAAKAAAAAAKPAAKPGVVKAAVAPSKSGIMKSVAVSPALSQFLGVPEISRSECVKKIWDYIKLHQLQNPANKKEIHCDDKLKTIFDGKDKVGMLEIAKLISPHFLKSN